MHDLPGTPDIVFVRQKVAVQVRGCFWHQHPGCQHCRIPETRQDYWKPKLLRTVERDAENDKALQLLGWRLVVKWECELKTEEMVNAAVEEICQELGANEDLQS